MKYEVPVSISFETIKLSVFDKEIFVRNTEPFRDKKLNRHFHVLISLLQEGTGKLVVNFGGETVTADEDIIEFVLSAVVRSNLKKMTEANVLAKVMTGAKTAYYVNPKYAFCGKEVPSFLLQMFEVEEEDLRQHNKYWMTKNLSSGRKNG